MAQHVHPVFLIHKSLPAVKEKEYSVAEICAAAERTKRFELVEGAQRIGGLWRVYASDRETPHGAAVGQKPLHCPE